MNVYYLFLVKKDVYNVYSKNSYSLYKLFYNLYNLNRVDFNYGVTLYNQLCDNINVSRLKYYFELTDNIRKGNNRYMMEDKSLVLLRPSCILYKKEGDFDTLFYLLNSFSHYFFACNFKCDDYFWVKNKINY